MSKKVKQIHGILDEVVKQRNIYKWDQIPTLVKKLTSTLGTNSKSSLPRCLTVEVLIEEKRFSEAKQEAQEALKQHSNDPILLFLLGRVEYLRKQYSNSLTTLENALQHLEVVYLKQQHPTSASDIDENNAHLFHVAYRAVYFQCIAVIGHCYRSVHKEDKAIEVYAKLYDQLSLQSDILKSYITGNASTSTSTATNQTKKVQHVFNQIDGFSLFSIQYSMLQLPELLVKKGKYVDALLILRSFFENNIYMHKDIQVYVLRQIGSILSRFTSNIDESKVYEQEVGNDKEKKNNLSFIPKEASEEALLVLLIIEQLSSNNLNLRQQPEVMSLYDDICLILSRNRKYAPLRKFLERGLTKYYESFHFWYQFALVLMSNKYYSKALRILSECEVLNTKFPPVLLLRAKVHLMMGDKGDMKECLRCTQRAFEIGGAMKARAQHCMGLAYGNLVSKACTLTERNAYQQKAIEALRKAFSMDTEDYLICYHLALQYAENREIRKAFHYVKKSISMNADNVDSWILLTLLFTVEKEYKNALAAVKKARSEYPHDIKLMLVQARLDEIHESEKKILFSYNTAFEQFIQQIQRSLSSKSALDPDNQGMNQSEMSSSHINNKNNPSSPSEVDIKGKSLLANPNDANGSSSANDGAANAEDKLVFKNMKITIPSTSNEYEREKIWKKMELVYLFISDALRRHSRFKEAQDLVNTISEMQQEAGYEISADVHHHKGLIAEDFNRMEEALNEYETGLICDENNKMCLMHMGLLQYDHFKQKLLARSYLQSAIRVDPNFHEAWCRLGIIMKEMGELEEASNCLITALRLQKSAPIIPFNLLLKRKL